MRGKIRIKKTFDEPLPKELLASFGGGVAADHRLSAAQKKARSFSRSGL
jgi:hypothetical protein